VREAVPQDGHKLLQLLRVSRHESDCLGHSLNFVSAFRVGVVVKSEIHSLAYFNNHLTMVQMSPCINAVQITPTGSPASLSRRHMFVGPAQPQFLLTGIDFLVYLIGVSLLLIDYYFLKVHLHHFSKIKSHKEVTNNRSQCLSYYFCLMVKGSGSVYLTNGSGSGRPKNIYGRFYGSGSATLLRTTKDPT
jgi:hypothetical protein